MGYFSQVELDREVSVMTEKERLEERLLDLNFRLNVMQDEGAPYKGEFIYTIEDLKMCIPEGFKFICDIERVIDNLEFELRTKYPEEVIEEQGMASVEIIEGNENPQLSIWDYVANIAA